MGLAFLDHLLAIVLRACVNIDCDLFFDAKLEWCTALKQFIEFANEAADVNGWVIQVEKNKAIGASLFNSLLD